MDSVSTGINRKGIAAALCWRRLIAPLAVFILALGLRLDRLWLVQFKLDEAALAGRALSLVEGRYLPLAGNSAASGVLNPPNFVYLLALPHALYQHPIAGSAFLALLGALAAPSLYLLIERCFDRPTALVASLLLAVNPWAVWHSRTIWEPNSVHLFVVLFAIALFALVLDGSSRALAGSIVVLAFLPTLHQSTIVLVPLWLFGLALRWDRLRWRPILTGFAAAIVLYLPYLYGEYTRGWVSFKTLFAQPAGQSRIDDEALRQVIELVFGFAYFTPSLEDGDVVGSVLATSLRGGEAALCLLGLLSLDWMAVRGDRRRRAASWLVLAWIAIPVAMSTRHWLAMHVHYFLTVVPALTIAAGVGAVTLARLLEKLDLRLHGAVSSSRSERPIDMSSIRPAVIAVALVVALVVGSQIWALDSVNSNIAAGRRDRYFYGVPIGLTSDVTRYLAARGISEAVVVSSGPDLARAIQVLTRDRIFVTPADERHSLPLPSESGTVYVVTENGSRAADYAARTFGTWRRATIDEPGRAVYSVYEVPPASDAVLDGGVIPIGARFANDVRAIDASYPRIVAPGETLTLTVRWATSGKAKSVAGADDRTVAFASLSGETVRSLVQAHDYDHAPSAASEAGEWISWLDLELPADTPSGLYHIDTGLYRSDGFVNVPIVGSNGTAVAEQLRFGPIRVASRPNSYPSAPTIPVRADLGQTIELDGYDLSRPGSDELIVTLYWTALRQPSTDYQAFLHLTDRSGKPIAQSDTMPGRIPTSLWQEGETIQDEHRISIPPSLAAGEYDVRIGLYELHGGSRLPIAASERPSSDDAILLQTISLP